MQGPDRFSGLGIRVRNLIKVHGLTILMISGIGFYLPRLCFSL